MASLLNLPGLQDLLDGTSNWLTGDYRLALLSTNTTADTENNIATVSAYATLDEFNGAGYARQALAGEAVNVDSVNNRIELDGSDSAFGALSNGTRSIQGVLVHDFVTNDADSPPLAFIQFASNIAPGGASLTIVWNAEGIVQFA